MAKVTDTFPGITLKLLENFYNSCLSCCSPEEKKLILIGKESVLNDELDPLCMAKCKLLAHTDRLYCTYLPLNRIHALKKQKAFNEYSKFIDAKFKSKQGLTEERFNSIVCLARYAAANWELEQSIYVWQSMIKQIPSKLIDKFVRICCNGNSYRHKSLYKIASAHDIDVDVKISDEGLNSLCVASFDGEFSKIDFVRDFFYKYAMYVGALNIIQNNQKEYNAYLLEQKQYDDSISLFPELSSCVSKEKATLFRECRRISDDITLNDFFEDIQNLQEHQLQYIKEYLADHSMSEAFEYVYGEYRQEHPNAVEIEFLPDKQFADIVPLPKLEPWTEASLTRLYGELIKVRVMSKNIRCAFVSKDTSLEDFLYALGWGSEDHYEEVKPIKWTGMFNGKPGKNQIIDLLVQMGYDFDELKSKKSLLNNVNSCFYIVRVDNTEEGVNLKPNNFSRGSESDMHKKLTEIVEKALG